MSDERITADMVEAAAKAMCVHPFGMTETWDEYDEREKQGLLETARTSLEAVLPDILDEVKRSHAQIVSLWDSNKEISVELKVKTGSLEQGARELAELRAKLAAVEEHNLVTLVAAQHEWSKSTFGPGDRLDGILDHIRKEFVEVEENPADVTEWLDIVILALDGAWRSSHTPEQIVTALIAKYEKNRNRKWPDWRTAEAGKAIEHDESDPIDRGCVTCGRDNRNGTHTALEQTGHLSHKWSPSLRAALGEGGAG